MSVSQRPDAAGCRVTGTTGVFVSQFNMASSTRTGAGAYTLVTSQTFDANSVVECQALAGVAAANIQVAPQANFLNFLITIFAGAAGLTATDLDFSFYVERIIQ
jgi:hypothetical protein